MLQQLMFLNLLLCTLPTYTILPCQPTPSSVSTLNSAIPSLIYLTQPKFSSCTLLLVTSTYLNLHPLTNSLCNTYRLEQSCATVYFPAALTILTALSCSICLVSPTDNRPRSYLVTFPYPKSFQLCCKSLTHSIV